MNEKIQISERALFARVSRKLLKERQILLKRCRADRAEYPHLGAYYSVSLLTHTVTDTHIDLFLWAKELGSIKPYEELVYA